MESSTSTAGSVNNAQGRETTAAAVAASTSSGGNNVDSRQPKSRSRESRGPSGLHSGAASGIIGGDVIQVDMAALAHVLGKSILYLLSFQRHNCTRHTRDFLHARIQGL